MSVNQVFCLVFLLHLTFLTINGQALISPDEFTRMRVENGSRDARLDSSDEHLFDPKKPYVDALEALFGIGVRLELLFQDSVPHEKNFLVSPLSMAVVVAQLVLGAHGKLRNYLADLLMINGGQQVLIDDSEVPLLNIHQQLSNLLRDLQRHGNSNNSYILETASAMFLQRGLSLKPVFNKSIHDFYSTSIVPMDFASAPMESFLMINQWASQHTHGRINQILPVPLPPSSAAVLANAVYFKGDWETPFSVDLTTEGEFNILPNKTVITTYLRGQLDISYADSKELNCTMIVLPYKDRKMSMYIVLPKADQGKEYSIKNFTTKLRTRDIYRLMRLTRLRTVRVILPKINLSSTISLLEPLKKYKHYKEILEKKGSPLQRRFIGQLRNKFDIIDNKIETFKEIEKENKNLSKPVDISIGKEKDPIDLSGASNDPRFKLTDIVQQMSLAINEKGTEAAAITSGSISLSGGLKDFFATRPFLFFIRDETTEAMLFWGTIVNPSS